MAPGNRRAGLIPKGGKSMRASTVVVLIALLCGVCWSSGAQAIDLTKYTFPTSTSQEAYLNGTFNVNGTSTDSAL